jgi:hypothetical protein
LFAKAPRCGIARRFVAVPAKDRRRIVGMSAGVVAPTSAGPYGCVDAVMGARGCEDAVVEPNTGA